MPRKRAPNPRKGRMTRAERTLLDTVAQGIDSKADMDQAVKTLANELAPVMGRNPESLRSALREARERVHLRALEYADAHHAAVQGALKDREWDVAAKHSWQALERLNHDGESVLAPKRAEGAESGITVNIALPFQLGGAKSKPQNTLPPSEVIDADPDGY